MYVAVEWYANRAKATLGRVRTLKAFAKLEEALLQIWQCFGSAMRLRIAFIRFWKAPKSHRSFRVEIFYLPER
jgi:hypothetical protein